MDTIFALASAPGKAGVSIIRVSGPNVGALASIGVQIGRHDRRLVSLVDQNGELVDQAFAISFDEGRSFTGEHVVEIHTHGSPAIVKTVLSLLEDLGLRLAEPGEFTRRALENGQLDLAQVEGLADLIDAETEAQRKQALRVFSGDMGELIDRWRADILRAAALLEATIDFVDEDVPVDVLPEVEALVTSILADVRKEAAGVQVRERLRSGFEVALVGAPNAGKSTLLNKLAGRDAAITSDIAGTTRDVIEVQMDLGGYPVTFLDTAGIRSSSDVLEGVGIERGLERARLADVCVHLVQPDVDEFSIQSQGKVIRVQAKSDVSSVNEGLAISGKTGDGIDLLIDEIKQHLDGLTQDAGIASRQRHESALREAEVALEAVLSEIATRTFLTDLVAEELRSAIRSLDGVVGRIDVESVLGEIFSSFCIGK